jgi:serine/threonine protein kinase/Tfp pilus assembly protein PilF
MIGKTISHYEILEKLGEGGMGVVYKAHDEKLHRDVALKFLPHYLTSDSTERERFLHEARAAATLNHPNIATVHEIDEHDGRLFLAMELIEGGTLRDLLGKEPMSVEKVLDIGIQVSEGLSAAHEKGIIHRDIKPENIMVTAKGHAKIMDFGLARIPGATKLTKAGSTLGTIGYMSPEQIRGEEVDRRSDIFSLGVVLFEMLAGGKPFRGEHEASISYSILNEDPLPIARFNNKVSPELDRIVLKALNKSRDERYQHADDFLADLRHERKSLDYGKSGYVRASGAQQTPTQEPKESRRRGQSALWKKVGIGVAVVGLIGVGLLMFRAERPFGGESVKSETNERKSIAVLPLQNLSGNQEDEFFSDGITEDIILQLSKIGELKVISRTSTMQYKGTKKNMREIGKELGVATILEGSVRRAGGQIRIVTQLIDANTDEHLWAETYDREFKQIFAIQSEIAQKVAAQLKASLSLSVKEQIEKRPTKSLEAYEYYLKGREYYGVHRREDNERAINFFRKALELDANYAQAYAGIADGYIQWVVRYGYPITWLDSAETLAQKSISLDTNLAEGYRALGRLYLPQGRVRKSLEANHKALQLNPNHFPAMYITSYGNIFSGQIGDGILWAKKATSMTPLGAFENAHLGQAYLALGNDEETEKWFQRGLQLQPIFPDASLGLAALRLLQGQYDKSLVLIREALAESPGYVALLQLSAFIQLVVKNYSEAGKLYRSLALTRPYLPGNFPLGVLSEDYDAGLGIVALRTGKKTEAKRFFERSLEANRKAIDGGNELYHYRYNIAAVYAVQGDKEAAYEWLKKAVDAGWRLYRIAQIDPFFENLRNDERYKNILAGVKAMVDEERRKVEEWERSEASGKQ